MYWSLENVPWTNLHDLNLDWIVNTMKQTVEQWIAYRLEMNQKYADFTEQINTDFDDFTSQINSDFDDFTTQINTWKTLIENEFSDLQTYVQTYFDNLDLNESTRYVINQMIASGEFIQVLNPSIVSATENWLATHITPTTPAVDNTLSIPGAAADAKVTGEGISNLKNALGAIKSTEPLKGANLVGNVDEWASGESRTDGGITYKVIDGVLVMDGTATGESFYYICDSEAPAWAKTGDRYKIDFVTTNDAVKVDIRFATSGIAYQLSYQSNKNGFFVTNKVTTRFILRVYVPTGTVLNADTAVICVRKYGGSETNGRLSSLDGNIYYNAEIGNVTITDDYWVYSPRSNRARMVQGETIHLKKGDTIDIDSGIRVYFGYIDGNKNYHTVNWKSIKYLVEAEGDYTFVAEYNDQRTIENIDELMAGIKFTRPSAMYTKINANLANNVMRFQPYYDHLFIQSNSLNNFIIGHNSPQSIQISKRLGFDVIEINVVKTSDNKYICMHQVNNHIPIQFYSLGGEDVTTINAESKTLEWLTTNLRYNSQYPKYRVAPLSLEDFLFECKSNDLIPFLACLNPSVIDIANRVVGKDNYIAYGAEREWTSAPIYHYKALTTKDAILEHCRSYGPPYIYGMANPSAFTDSQLKDIVKSLHEEGYLIGAADVYHTEDVNLRNRLLGFDCYASGWSIPHLATGNVYNKSSGENFNEFVHQGTVANGVLTLGLYASIRSSNGTPDTTCFLGGGTLGIRFKGRVTVTLGQYISNSYGGNTIESDGNKMLWFSSYFMNSPLDFIVSAVEDGVEIYDIVYRASQC